MRQWNIKFNTQSEWDECKTWKKKTNNIIAVATENKKTQKFAEKWNPLKKKSWKSASLTKFIFKLLVLMTTCNPLGVLNVKISSFTFIVVCVSIFYSVRIFPCALPKTRGWWMFCSIISKIHYTLWLKSTTPFRTHCDYTMILLALFVMVFVFHIHCISSTLYLGVTTSPTLTYSVQTQPKT